MQLSPSSGPRSITARGAATRARIVAAAADLIYAQGVKGTSLDDVMAASSTSKSQLYHYFASKEALVEAVVQTQTDRVLAFQLPLLEQVATLADLRAWRDAIVAMTRMSSGVGGCPLGSLAGDVADHSEEARLLAVRGFAAWEARLATCLQRLRDSSEVVADAEPNDLALSLLGALQGGLLLAQTTRTTRPLELALDMALEHIGHRSR